MERLRRNERSWSEGLLSLSLVVLLCLCSTAAAQSAPTTNFPLLGLAIASNDWASPCGSDYPIVLYNGNGSDPLEYIFNLPFPNSGIFNDGIVTIDETNKVVYTFISTIRNKGQSGHNGGFLIGLLALNQDETPYGGIISSSLLTDFTPYTLDFFNGTLWSWGVSASGQYLFNIDPATGALSTVFTLPKDHTLKSLDSGCPAAIDGNGIYYATTYSVSSSAEAYIYSFDLTSLQVISVTPLSSPTCIQWVYDGTTGNTYALCSEDLNSNKGFYLATIDLATLSIKFIGTEPLVSAPHQAAVGTFTVDTQERIAYVISLAKGSQTWLAQGNLTTGEAISEFELLGTGAFFMTYLPWLSQ